uniref:hypothetical protein n=1 Tax=Cupriavidus taiwanensis TaxID=164546 RepID=UPI003F494C9E
MNRLLPMHVATHPLRQVLIPAMTEAAALIIHSVSELSEQVSGDCDAEYRRTAKVP